MVKNTNFVFGMLELLRLIDTSVGGEWWGALPWEEPLTHAAGHRFVSVVVILLVQNA